MGRIDALTNVRDSEGCIIANVMAMAVYGFRCAIDGDFDVHRPMSESSLGAVCPTCGLSAQRIFSFAMALIEAGGDDVMTADRIADGSSKFNIGLPGVSTVVGKNADGSDRTTYRPITHAELGSNRGARERGKRHGLEMVGEGRYRAAAPQSGTR